MVSPQMVEDMVEVHILDIHRTMDTVEMVLMVVVRVDIVTVTPEEVVRVIKDTMEVVAVDNIIQAVEEEWVLLVCRELQDQMEVQVGWLIF
jgi:hypothetical protein